MINEPIKITNLQTLKLEKQRLKIFCSFQEEILKEKIFFVKTNYKQIILKELLPFNSEKNNKISGILDWVNEFFLGNLLKMDIKGENKLSGSIIKIAESAIINLFNKFSKK
jgi:hypothetical protein